MKAKPHTIAGIGAILAVLSITPGKGRADVSNQALCHVNLEVGLSDGTYDGKGTDLGCTGLVAGQLVRSGGSIETWGHYGEEQAGDACVLTWSSGVFIAHVRMAVTLVDDGDLELEGDLDMGSGAFIPLSGGGAVDSDPFLLAGSAALATPRAPCAALSSTTLREVFTIRDGGSGDPAADAQIAGYLQQEYGTPAAAPAPPTRRRRPARGRRHRRR